MGAIHSEQLLARNSAAPDRRIRNTKLAGQLFEMVTCGSTTRNRQYGIYPVSPRPSECPYCQMHSFQP